MMRCPRPLLMAALALSMLAATAQAKTGEGERAIVPAARYPWSAVVRVNSGHGWCSGVLVGPKLVATAAHCLWSKAAGRVMAPEALRVVAGWDRGEFLAAARVAGVTVAPAWRFADLAHYGTVQAANDWALLDLAAPLGTQVGWVGLGKDAAPAMRVFAVGYGQDLKHVPTAHFGCHLLSQVEGGLWLHTCDALHGDSGGPVMVWTKHGPRLAALHVAALGMGGGRTLGGAVGIQSFRAAALAHGAATTSHAGPLARPLDPGLPAKAAGR